MHSIYVNQYANPYEDRPAKEALRKKNNLFQRGFGKKETDGFLNPLPHKALGG
jgi:hypothetical protein